LTPATPAALDPPVPALRRRLFPLLPLPHGQCRHRPGPRPRTRPRRQRARPADQHLFPRLRRRPVAARHAARPLRAAPRRSRPAAAGRRRRRRFRHADTHRRAGRRPRLIGLGVSACLMASFKAFSQWFPPERQASLTGWIMASGGLGALAASPAAGIRPRLYRLARDRPGPGRDHAGRRRHLWLASCRTRPPKPRAPAWPSSWPASAQSSPAAISGATHRWAVLDDRRLHGRSGAVGLALDGRHRRHGRAAIAARLTWISGPCSPASCSWASSPPDWCGAGSSSERIYLGAMLVALACFAADHCALSRPSAATCCGRARRLFLAVQHRLFAGLAGLSAGPVGARQHRAQPARLSPVPSACNGASAASSTCSRRWAGQPTAPTGRLSSALLGGHS
jgi:hypothetical protein